VPKYQSWSVPPRFERPREIGSGGWGKIKPAWRRACGLKLPPHNTYAVGVISAAAVQGDSIPFSTWQECKQEFTPIKAYCRSSRPTFVGLPNWRERAGSNGGS